MWLCLEASGSAPINFLGCFGDGAKCQVAWDGIDARRLPEGLKNMCWGGREDLWKDIWKHRSSCGTVFLAISGRIKYDKPRSLLFSHDECAMDGLHEVLENLKH